MSSFALYPGTFDPATLGHLDIVRRAEPLFEKIIVAVAKGRHKNVLFSQGKRVDLARASFAELRKVEVLPFNDLAVEFARQQKCQAILRGLRAVSDFEYEFQMASMNRHLNSDIETIFLTPDEKHTHLSSSLIREICGLGGDVSSFVHPKVLRALQDKLGTA